MKTITEKEFSKLPINEQMFRWQIFIETEGYTKDITKKRIKDLEKEYNIKKKKGE